MADYTPITDLTNLGSTQKAFLISDDSGLDVKCVVDVRSQDVSASMFNAVADAHLGIQVTVWEINDDGTPKLSAGRKIGPSIKNHTILTAALADGTVVLGDMLTQMVMDALDRMVNWVIVHAQIIALLNASANASPTPQ